MTADLMRAADALVRQSACAEAPRARGAGEAWGTVREHDGILYVQVDGSSVWTPCKTLVEARGGDRVRVRIERHSYTITGNSTSPGASQGSVEAVRDEADRLAEEVAENDRRATEAIDRINSDELPAIRDAVQDAAHDITVIDTRLQVVDGALKGIEYETGQIRSDLEDAREVADGAAAAVEEATRTMLAGLKDSYEVETDAATLGGTLQALIEASAGGIASKVSREEWRQNSDEINGALGDLSDKLYGSREQLDELRRIEAQAAADLAAADAAASAARAELDELLSMETSPEIEAAIEAKRAEVAELAAQVSSAEAALAAAREAVAAAEGDIASLLALIGSMGDRITNAESSFEQTAADITLQFQQLVQGLDVTDESVLRLLTWFRFAIDGLVIGRSGNDMVAKLTNEGLGFVDDGSLVGYFANRSMYASSIIVMDEMRFNDFLWDKRLNGNLSLKHLTVTDANADALGIPRDVYRLFGIPVPGEEPDDGEVSLVPRTEVFDISFSIAELGNYESAKYDVVLSEASVASVEGVGFEQTFEGEEPKFKARLSWWRSYSDARAVTICAMGYGAIGNVRATVDYTCERAAEKGGGE